MRLLITLLLNAMALLITAYIVPGFKVDNFQAAVLTAVVLGLLNTFIKPLLTILTLPLTILTLGLFSFVLNALVLLIASAIVKGFNVDGLLPAILGSIVLSVVSTILSNLVKES